ncbi:hypothetical protein [Streptomyces parvulus]|uniref:hypothetical protein n=1 Tax=Streptomyces parvulus TaxID=146923 RepID=UPI00382E3DC2
MDTMSRHDLDDSEFRNPYTEAVAELIEAKREHREPAVIPEPAVASGQLIDLMAAFTESVLKAKESRGETGGHADVHEMPKRTAKKQPAKKPTAKRTTSRKPR